MLAPLATVMPRAARHGGHLAAQPCATRHHCISPRGLAPLAVVLPHGAHHPCCAARTVRISPRGLAHSPPCYPTLLTTVRILPRGPAPLATTRPRARVPAPHHASERERSAGEWEGGKERQEGGSGEGLWLGEECGLGE